MFSNNCTGASQYPVILMVSFSVSHWPFRYFFPADRSPARGWQRGDVTDRLSLIPGGVACNQVIVCHGAQHIVW